LCERMRNKESSNRGGTEQNNRREAKKKRKQEKKKNKWEGEKPPQGATGPRPRHKASRKVGPARSGAEGMIFDC